MARLDHVNISVSNLEESLTWYGDLFGFKKVEGGVSAFGARWAIISCEDSMIALHEYPQRERADGEKAWGSHRIAHFGIRVDNAIEWRNKVERHGLKLYYGGEVRYPHSRSWYIHDPSGHEIEVSCTNGKSLRFS